MQPQLRILSSKLVPQIIDKAFKLLVNPGIKVQLREAQVLLADAGARVEDEREVVQIPKDVARKALETVPHEFYLYDQDGEPCVHYGGDSVHFDPGSSGVNVLDAETMKHRPATTHDLIKVIKTADSLGSMTRNPPRWSVAKSPKKSAICTACIWCCCSLRNRWSPALSRPKIPTP